jgi:hypothetical protein
MTDETKATKQDSSASQGTSAEDKGSTSSTQAPQTKTYTEKDLEKVRSDERAAAGRIKAEAERTKAELADLQRRLAEREKAEEEAEYDRVRKDPDQLTVFQTKQAIRIKERELALKEREISQREADHKAQMEEMNRWRAEQKAQELAKRYEVDSSLLLELSDGNLDKMTKAAERLSSATTKPTTGSGPRPDSGVTSGTRGEPTMEQLDEWARNDPARFKEYREKQGAQRKRW